jgi:hypothetical protein
MNVIRVFLYIAAILLLLQGFAIFLPFSAVNSILAIFGEEAFPDTSLIKYGLRLTLLIFFWIGIVALLALANPEKYRAILVVFGWGFLTGGAVCLVSGLIYGMSPIYYLGDFIFAVIVGILFLIYKPQVRTFNR